VALFLCFCDFRFVVCGLWFVAALIIFISNNIYPLN
jgi:hypothetical protein